jgi:hypothetical protein
MNKSYQIETNRLIVKKSISVKQLMTLKDHLLLTATKMIKKNQPGTKSRS